ncbi:MAG TPA: hypothetical protein VLR49_08745 [Ferruginibacter sp.]|nr:hypothetical protein [Ferruginibacter sp.]
MPTISFFLDGRVWGICWYPMVNWPGWDYLHNWHFAGIWDDVFDNNLPVRVCVQ